MLWTGVSPVDIYYNIEPNNCWAPDSVTLYIKDGENIIRTESLSTSIGEQYTSWDGKKDDESYAPPGEYIAVIEVIKEGEEDEDDVVCSDSHSIKVLRVRLESVTFGGSDYHTLYKKDSSPWDFDDEDFATDYDVAVPAKAWVRGGGEGGADLEEPICYTKGGDASATIEVSVYPSLGDETADATVRGQFGTVTDFFAGDISLTDESASSDEMDRGVLAYVCGATWPITWYITVGDEEDYYLGESENNIYMTWGVPSGCATAKRIRWATESCPVFTDTVEELGNGISNGIHGKTLFGKNENYVSWAALDYYDMDPEDPNLKVDCIKAACLAKESLELLGFSENHIETTLSYASSDETNEPDYPSDVTDLEWFEYEEDIYELWYTDNHAEDNRWNVFEGSFRMYDGNASKWMYWTCHPKMGPIEGAGDNKDKSALYEILDKIRDDNGSDFYQKWNGEGVKVALP